MKVILQENIDTLGRVGEIVSVADGYGRNYLLPRKKAILADERNVKILSHQKLLAQHKRNTAVKEAQALAKRIEAFSCSISKQVGENDKLYGSVTAMDIEEALRADKIEVDRRSIHLEEPIKTLGVFSVDVKLHPEVVAKLKVWVVKKP